MQFYEETDDISGFVDARYTNGLLKIWGVDLTPAENCPFIEMAAQEPDLSVSYNLAENSDDTVVGNNIEYTIDIINNGNGTATNIMVQHEISPKLRFTQFTCEDGSEFVNLESPINVSNIDAQSTLQCTLFAQIIAFGEINNSISVQTNDDSDTSNNSAVATITGAPVVIPSSNIFSLLLLLSVMMYYGRKRVIL